MAIGSSINQLNRRTRTQIKMTKEESEEELFKRLQYAPVDRDLLKLREYLDRHRAKYGKSEKDDKRRGSRGDNPETSED
jgi:hypothetical protein